MEREDEFSEESAEMKAEEDSGVVTEMTKEVADAKDNPSEEGV